MEGLLQRLPRLFIRVGRKGGGRRNGKFPLSTGFALEETQEYRLGIWDCVAAEITHQGKLCLCGQALCLQCPQKSFWEVASAKGFGKADGSHLKALDQLVTAAPKPVSQGFFFSLKPV